MVIPSGFSSQKPPERAGQVLVIGSRGNLGRAILKCLGDKSQGPLPATLDTRDVAVAIQAIRDLMATLTPSDQLNVIFAAGQTDPGADPDLLLTANLEFPKKIIENFMHAEAGPVRFVTLGSALEVMDRLAESNPYLNSKCRLSEWLSSHENFAGRVLHLRLHTLFGGDAKDHMFLGHMARALRNRTVFQMSSGEQLREFHSMDSVSAALATLVRCEWPFGPIVYLSHGEPLHLRELAEKIFAHFSCPELLDIGSLARPDGENTDRTFEPAPAWLRGESAPDSIELIQGWLRLLSENRPH
jgi:nucleoside-diphosphate-sugar epimerase